MRWLALLVMACDDTGSGPRDAPVVNTDAFEHECTDPAELHVFDEVTFTPGEWADAQLWMQYPSFDWVQEPISVDEDGHVFASCSGLPTFRLLVRR